MSQQFHVPHIGMTEAIPVIAYDFETRKKVNRYESMSQAARKLYIRSTEAIWAYMRRPDTGHKRSGVKSYKTKKSYHFEKEERVTPGQ